MPEDTDNSCDAVVVIVDYFKGARVLKNVRGLLAQENIREIRISIIDNSCDLNNENILSQLEPNDYMRLRFNERNEGYIRASNSAAAQFRSRYVVLVNPDISWISRTTLKELIDLMDRNPAIGIAGPRQINDDGTTPNTVRRFPDLVTQLARRTVLRDSAFFKSKVEQYELADFDYTKSQYVDWIQSSLLIIRRELWESTGGLDETYFIFMSDPELCFRAWELGYKVFYTAESVVGADGKRCSEGGILKIFTSKALRYHIRDAVLYQLKHLFRSRPERQALTRRY